MRAAVEAKRITREALDHKRERFKLEMKQIWDRYDQDRDVELEREDKTFRDAEGKVKGLEGGHRNYKHRKAAAEAQLPEHKPTGSPNTGQSRWWPPERRPRLTSPPRRLERRPATPAENRRRIYRFSQTPRVLS